MKRVLLICISTLIVTLTFSQDVYMADSLREAGCLKRAIKEYAKVYELDTTNRENGYQYACVLALDKRVGQAFRILDIATINDTTSEPLNEPDFYFLIEDKRWGEFQDRMIERIEEKEGKFENPELSKELWDMKIKDQAFYYHVFTAQKNEGISSLYYQAMWELKSKINEENLARLIEIIDIHGWPKESVVKEEAASAVFLIIQHADLETQKKYLPLMKEAANQGEASWSSLALLIDRINTREGKRQIYGSQLITNLQTGETYLEPIIDPERVNERRASVGLGTIEDYISNWGLIWDVEEHKKKTKELDAIQKRIEEKEL